MSKKEEPKPEKIIRKRLIKTNQKRKRLINSKLNRRRLLKNIGLLIVFEVFIFTMSREFLYSNSRTFALIIASITIFIAIPYCLGMILNELLTVKSISILGLASILLNGPLFGFYHLQRENNDLAVNGKLVTGKVIEKKFIDRKSGDYWTVKAKYKVEHKFYHTTFERPDSVEKYEIGDDIRIIYLDQYPRVYRVEGDVLKKWIKDN